MAKASDAPNWVSIDDRARVAEDDHDHVETNVTRKGNSRSDPDHQPLHISTFPRAQVHGDPFRSIMQGHSDVRDKASTEQGSLLTTVRFLDG